MSGSGKSGDGLTAAPASSFGTERTAENVSGNNQSTFEADFDQVAKSNAAPKRVSDADWTRFITKLEGLVGASSAETKRKVKLALVWVFAVNGTSPHTKWHTIPFAVPGCRTVNALDVIKLMSGRPIKHYLVHLHGDTMAAYATSQRLRDSLAERYTRNGLTEEEGYLAIDYLDASLLMGDTRVNRQYAKDQAIIRQRANASAEQSVQSAQAASTGATAQRVSNTGPIAGAGDRFGGF